MMTLYIYLIGLLGFYWHIKPVNWRSWLNLIFYPIVIPLICLWVLVRSI